MQTLAYLNHGRWVADCPLGCGCAALVSDDVFRCRQAMRRDHYFRRLGWSDSEIDAAMQVDESDVVLHDCGADGATVIWPANKTEIEDICAARPMENRNWYPHETADQLRAENLEHGIGV